MKTSVCIRPQVSTNGSIRPQVSTNGRAQPRSALLILTEGVVWFKKINRSGFRCIDKSEDGGLTWAFNIVTIPLDEDSIIIDIDSGVVGYRHEVRGGAYCIDIELTPMGFDGSEDTDWENIYSTL